MPLLLPREYQLPPGKLVILFRFHFKTKKSDVDNCVKQAQDIITEYYGCDDREIYMLIVEKIVNSKSDEYLEFEFLEYNESMFNDCRDLMINSD